MASRKEAAKTIFLYIFVVLAVVCAARVIFRRSRRLRRIRRNESRGMQAEGSDP